MSEYHEILQGFSVGEFHSTESEKQALRACAELLLTTSEDYATATSLAMLLLANKPEGFVPSEDFLEQHPDNHPREYSGPAAYVAFFLLYLAEKARSAKDIVGEAATCTHYTTACMCDLNICSKCADRGEVNIPIGLMRYEDIPPYHLGCRCKPLLIQRS